ncbi:rhomboid family intramembrane serine protease [Pseudomonas sp. 5P_3.1_Bac2]|uniref:rhomboid family intramembrane serine protease n=1 Tax=Pseudomonas sp. 5P_3.1_Bac2 TaxID=2971617 RepID=UPI0021C64AF7|nr:rhomboid family intramembrane serine protease [Pseudomonas sp. 5P_3.1_Bac2]MCU1716042.1 rhomboid family intramembrane serine protease [Pseudomonas sp. 5P_3.1_Bac2]
MSAIAALRVSDEINLSGFVQMLKHLQLPHRVAEEAGEQVLWVPSAAYAEQVRELYQRFPLGDVEGVLAGAEPAPRPYRPGLLQQLKASPMTTAVLLLCFVVAVITWLGDNLEAVSWLSFVDFRVEGEYGYFTQLSDTLAEGQWWRLVSPMLLHFGILHLAMNSLWFWELGRRIEYRQGRWLLLGLTLLFSLGANLAQYWYSGPSIFGGLSGVLYGLLGHCWIYQKLAPNPVYELPRGVLIMMLVWLVVCMTGVFELLQFGAIANAAHVGGLLAGCVTGLLGGALARRQR